jgi:hypothetical protein
MGPPNRSVTLYDSGFGDLGDGIDRGVSRFRNDGSTHNTVSGDGHHFSWDQSETGDVSNMHFVDDSPSKGSVGRHPFDR